MIEKMDIVQPRKSERMILSSEEIIIKMFMNTSLDPSLNHLPSNQKKLFANRSLFSLKNLIFSPGKFGITTTNDHLSQKLCLPSAISKKQNIQESLMGLLRHMQLQLIKALSVNITKIESQLF